MSSLGTLYKTPTAQQLYSSARLSIKDDPRGENQKLADHRFEVRGSGFFLGPLLCIQICDGAD